MSMDIKGSGNIESFGKCDDGSVEVVIAFKGKASDVAQPAKEASGELVLSIKSLVAEKLHYGEKLYVSISTKPPEET